MKTAQIVKTIIYYVFKCPHCSCKYECSKKEVKQIGKYKCWSCDKVVLFGEKSHSIKKTKEQKVAVTKTYSVDKIKQDVIIGLVRLGMSKQDAKQYVMQNDFETSEEYFLNLPKKG